MARERESEEEVGRADNNLAGARKAASDPRQSGRALEQADDRGGSRDGERMTAGEAGDREQLDNDDGRTPSRR
jgi:hypothetical protein